MANSNRGFAVLALVVLSAVVGCADGSIDDPDGPSSVLEILNLQNQPVTCSVQNGVCQGDSALSCTSNSGCVVNQVDLGPCFITTTLLVQPWTGSAANEPLTPLAGTQPFNDITLDSVTIQYNWVDIGCSTPTRVIGLGGVVIPANQTAPFNFHPISLQDVQNPCLPLTGSTADLTLTFNAQTPTESFSHSVSRQLFIQTCSGLGG